MLAGVGISGNTGAGPTLGYALLHALTCKAVADGNLLQDENDLDSIASS